MLRISRLEKIKQLIHDRKAVKVSDLSKKFDVSEETIRRDLQELENVGILTRAYGGAFISQSVKADVDIKVREYIHVPGKKKIAEKCAELIQDGDSVFLDASTTSLYIVNYIVEKKLTIVTNSLKIVNYLAERDNIKLMFLGGGIDPNSLSALGRSAEQNIKRYFFDLAIISCSSVSMAHGLMDSNEKQAQIRSIALENAKKSILAIDYTKLDKISFASIHNFSKIDTLVIDAKLSESWKQFLKMNEITFFECDSVN